MIYFLVTTSLYNNCQIRRKQYVHAIQKLQKIIETLSITDSKIIVIENNGNRHTFLNDLGCDVFYTKNNFLKTKNKGIKELQDIKDCIVEYDIKNDDFIVKMTGRYILMDDSEFMQVLQRRNELDIDCIIKYGSYMKPVDYQVKDCITGLIGMKCEFVKEIEQPMGNKPVEWKWAAKTYDIDKSRIYNVKKLGIHICPGCNTYFQV